MVKCFSILRLSLWEEQCCVSRDLQKKWVLIWGSLIQMWNARHPFSSGRAVRTQIIWQRPEGRGNAHSPHRQNNKSKSLESIQAGHILLAFQREWLSTSLLPFFPCIQSNRLKRMVLWKILKIQNLNRKYYHPGTAHLVKTILLLPFVRR